MVKISIVEKEDKQIVKLGVYIDTPSTPEAEKALTPLLLHVDKDIVFDCIDLDFIASSVLRLILKVLKNAKAEGHHAYIVNMAPNIREAFQLTGFLNLFDQM